MRLINLLAVAAFATVSTAASAALSFYEPFAGTAATPVTTSGAGSGSSANGATLNAWTTHSGTNQQILYTAGGLSYTGLDASSGGHVLTTTAGTEDIGYSFAPAVTSFYASHLVEFVSTDLVTQAAGDYYFHATEGTTSSNFRGRVFARPGTTAGTVNLGIRYGSSGDVQWAAAELAADTTHFIVLKINVNAGTDDDTASLFINPTPGAAEPAATVTSLPTPAQDITAGIDRVAIRQGGASDGGFRIDEIRAGSTWGDVTPGTTNADGWEMYF